MIKVAKERRRDIWQNNIENDNTHYMYLVIKVNEIDRIQRKHNSAKSMIESTWLCSL